MQRSRLALAAVTIVALAAAVPVAGSIDFKAEQFDHVTGPIDYVTCDVEAVQRANDAQLSTLLNEVMNTTFFSLFKADLTRKCEFWVKPDTEEDKEEKCETSLPVFSVAGASDPFSVPAEAKSACSLDTDAATATITLPFEQSSDPISRGPVPVPPGMEMTDDCELPAFWLDMCTDIPTGDAEYTNLQANPERWTGYNGAHIWDAIYKENCFSRAENMVEMCYEEQVLYRLLSGMHSSINIHIALNYFPPNARKGRSSWETNSARYDELFKAHPARLKNLHFAFVVTLRALKKATPYLYDYSYNVGDPIEDFRAQKLVRRLLDTHIMNSCAEVFEAFDESLMFGDSEAPSTVATLKHNFKGVFQNISRVLDCVACQKCKLHGKLILLGVGTALKVLLLPEEMVGSALSREEVVALFNTVGKLSQAIIGIKTLTKQSWEQRYFDATGKLAAQKKEAAQLTKAAENALTNAAAEAALRAAKAVANAQATAPQLPSLQSDELADIAIGIVEALASTNVITDEVEEKLVLRAMAREPNLLILANRYRSNPAKFLKFATTATSGPPSAKAMATAGTDVTTNKADPDVVVVGAGLAGLTAALTLADRGARVMLVDKNKFTGGNSAYASSGINAVGEKGEGSTDSDDSALQYLNDTIRSSGRAMDMNADTLPAVLAKNSWKALEWFRSRVGMQLEAKGQLGGHSAARTYRPSTGMAGSEMVYAITKLVKALSKADKAKFDMRLGTELVSLETDDQNAISGVTIRGGDGVAVQIATGNVVLATGGFANDRAGGDSLLEKYRPDLSRYHTTNGPFATGDGHKVAYKAGAGLIDMDQVQVHPTAFVGGSSDERLTLCAEILRGVGAILLNGAGARFADELGKRDYLTAEINKATTDAAGMTLLVPEAGAKIATKHVPHYMKKGLLTKLETITDVAAWMKVPEKDLRATFAEYKANAEAGFDAFGKKFFHNADFLTDAGPYYAGRVTPAIHYSLGGVSIDTAGRVLRPDGAVFAGLYAAGEITGGVHGVNRLGGNALTECVVFGQLVAEGIGLGDAGAGRPGETAAGGNATAARTVEIVSPATRAAPEAAAQSTLPAVTPSQLGVHASAENCHIAVGGKVYDFSDFVEEHPGGVETIEDNCGYEATEVFDAVHTRAMLDDFDPIGEYKE